MRYFSNGRERDIRIANDASVSNDAVRGIETMNTISRALFGFDAPS